MSWNYRINQRDRIALALGAVFLIIVLANWLVGYSMQQVSGQFRSVYEDRLKPALYISAMQEHYYQSQMLLEKHIAAPDAPAKAALQEELETHRTALDSLVKMYEVTYLTNQESRDFAYYLHADSDLNEATEEILELSGQGQQARALYLFRADAKPAFRRLLRPLHALSQLQEEVGHELYASAESRIKGLKVLSYLVIGMAVILALLVGTLLQTSRKLKQVKPQHFHLN